MPNATPNKDWWRWGSNVTAFICPNNLRLIIICRLGTCARSTPSPMLVTSYEFCGEFGSSRSGQSYAIAVGPRRGYWPAQSLCLASSVSNDGHDDYYADRTKQTVTDLSGSGCHDARNRSVADMVWHDRSYVSLAKIGISRRWKRSCVARVQHVERLRRDGTCLQST
jgi:hypothetical protein